MSSPRQFGHYEVLGPLGAGGMGEVWVARDPILGRKVAIKVLPVRLSGDRDTLTRFTQEARSASALNHPNIVTIYEVGAEDGIPYMVMEHIEGRDLRTLINEGPMNARKTLEIAAQIADGLAAAHEQGIVHRDLKPENLMLTKDGFVKILDFGLAKVVRPIPEDGDDTLQLEMPGTNPGTILGTAGYMSPEQATGKRLDFRSDQFALGAILYELATGRSPFEGKTTIDTLSAILHNDPEPIRSFNVKAPEPFCWIVERLLAKDPEERYASTRDLARELKTVRDRVSAEPSSLDHPRPPRWRKSRQRALLIGGIAALALLLVGLAVVLGRGARPDSSAPVTASLPPGKSYLAVLRFKDLSGDPKGQLIGDGFADTLSTRLARLPSVQLIRPTNLDTLASEDMEKVGRDLGVNLVLRGSMQRQAERIRISYSIIDVHNHSQQLSGDTIDGAADQIFDIQDKLVASVAAFLDPNASPQRYASLDPAISQKRYLEALGYLRRADSEESLNHSIEILEALAAKSNSATLQASLGRAYLQKFIITRDPRLIRDATAYCERALANDPQNAEVYVTFGQVQLQNGKPEQAVASFDRAVAQQPNNVDAVLGLADAYRAEKDLGKAESAYQQAIALQPKYWVAYNALGVFYFVNARYAEAATMFQKVIQLVPDNFRGYNNLGAAYQQMGRYDDAIGVFSRTLEEKPSAQGYSNLGTCYYFLGRYGDSAHMFEKAVALAPNSWLYWSNLGDAYRWAVGLEKKADDAYDRAIALCRDELHRNPKDVEIRARLAECLAKRGQMPEAQKQLAQAMTTDKDNLVVLYRAAVIATIRGDQTEAIKCVGDALHRGYNKAEIQLDPEFGPLRKTDAFQKLLGSVI